MVAKTVEGSKHRQPTILQTQECHVWSSGDRVRADYGVKMCVDDLVKGYPAHVARSPFGHTSIDINPDGVAISLVMFKSPRHCLTSVHTAVPKLRRRPATLPEGMAWRDVSPTPDMLAAMRRFSDLGCDHRRINGHSRVDLNVQVLIMSTEAVPPRANVSLVPCLSFCVRAGRWQEPSLVPVTTGELVEARVFLCVDVA